MPSPTFDVAGPVTAVPLLGTVTAVATCPVGSTVTGGGYDISGLGTAVVQETFQVGNTWSVEAGGALLLGVTIEAHATCLPLT
ncbi:hypothetical protein [Streptosporangium sp. NPDC002524]|uniref:hypothetical protein n=1 Tax=Streptosporangium sp. NPDC002524 TaxID=3154537 RepID=UPI0033272834